jgi:hypothetical protein
VKKKCTNCETMIRPKTTGLCRKCFERDLRSRWDGDVVRRLQSYSPCLANCCWEWAGSVDKDGYGRVRFQGRCDKAHRIAYKLANPEWDGSGMVLHSCDNPPCCNPTHLRNGDQIDNFSDMISRDRHAYLGKKGSSHHKSKLNGSDVIEIRRLRAIGVTLTDLSRWFGVSQAAISLAARGKTWAHI